jgi:hypothetical protein
MRYVRSGNDVKNLKQINVNLSLNFHYEWKPRSNITQRDIYILYISTLLLMYMKKKL